MTSNLWKSVAVLLLLAGCKSDPFSHTDPLKIQKPPEKPEPLPLLVLDVPLVMEFKEGTKGDYTVRAQVQEGSPEVSVIDLPKGATFDATKLMLTWNPGFDAANDPKDPMTVLRKYPVTFILRSSTNPTMTLTKPVLLAVNDTARPMDIQIEKNTDLKEGTKFEQKITIKSEDFPTGPFQVTADKLPPQAMIRELPGNPNVHVITYVPDFFAVTTQDPHVSQVHQKRLDDLTFTVRSPRTKSEVKTAWIINDVRQTPRISGPSDVNQGLEVSIGLTVEDLNGEETPKVTLAEPGPFGKLTIETKPLEFQPGITNPVTAAVVRWENVPTEQLGKTYPLKVNGCVRKYKFDMVKTVCSQKVIKISFVGAPHPAPVINRAQWLSGVIKYFRLGQKEVISLPIHDPESTLSKPIVEISPKELQGQISWANNQLTVNPNALGVKSFAVVAKSGFGVVQVENFTFEALPASWNVNLLLATSTSDPEIVQTRALLNGGSDVANSELQALDERLLALRNNLLLGTSLLDSKEALAGFEAASATVKTLSISSPLLDLFKGPTAQIIKDLGVELDRYSTFPSPPALKDIALVSLGLTPAGSTIHLKGKLTGESASPMVLTLKSTKCKPLLALKNSTDEYVVAAQCTLPGNRTLVLAGFEWADIDNATQAKTWINEVVKR